MVHSVQQLPVKAETIWTNEELRTWIYNVREGAIQNYGRELYVNELNDWELEKAREAVSYREKNDAIDDITIVNTLHLIFDVAQEYRSLQDFESEEPCCICESSDGEDFNFIYSNCMEKVEVHHLEQQQSTAESIQGVLYSIESLLAEARQ